MPWQCTGLLLKPAEREFEYCDLEPPCTARGDAAEFAEVDGLISETRSLQGIAYLHDPEPEAAPDLHP
jgi:hypothetical protein